MPTAVSVAVRIWRKSNVIQHLVAGLLLIVGHRHLERVLTAWFEHYNQARPHRGLGLRTPIARSDPVIAMPGKVVCCDVLGGLLREYSVEPLSESA